MPISRGWETSLVVLVTVDFLVYYEYSNIKGTLNQALRHTSYTISLIIFVVLPFIHIY